MRLFVTNICDKQIIQPVKPHGMIEINNEPEEIYDQKGKEIKPMQQLIVTPKQSKN